MKKLIKKISFIASVVLIVASSFSTFATGADTSAQNKARVNSTKKTRQ